MESTVSRSKKEWKTEKEARKAVLNYIETWNQYLSGDVYGYLIENELGEETGGCWGFYGTEYETNGLLDSAMDEIEDEILKDKRKKAIARQIA